MSDYQFQLCTGNVLVQYVKCSIFMAEMQCNSNIIQIERINQTTKISNVTFYIITIIIKELKKNGI